MALEMGGWLKKIVLFSISLRKLFSKCIKCEDIYGGYIPKELGKQKQIRREICGMVWVVNWK